jgi:hypothetical protein
MRSYSMNGLKLLLISLASSTAFADGGAPVLSEGSNSFPSTGSAEYASPERSQAAVGHYARAQKLLIEALREFDAGRKIARPDLVFNPENWRSTVSSRTEELTHIISPQARETTGGMRTRSNAELVDESYLKKKEVAAATPVRTAPRLAAKKAKTKVHEQLVSATEPASEIARARMAEKKAESVVPAISAPAKEEVKTEVRAPLLAIEPPSLEDSAVDNAKAQVKDPELESQVDAEMKRALSGAGIDSPSESAEAKPKTVESEPRSPVEEESEVAKALDDDEVRARLKKLAEEIAQEEKKAQ